jgi:hypothetical protein
VFDAAMHVLALAAERDGWSCTGSMGLMHDAGGMQLTEFGFDLRSGHQSLLSSGPC